MVSWWKRLAYSLVSVLAVSNLCGVCALIPQFAAGTSVQRSFIGWVGVLAFFEVLLLQIVMPCWLLVAPLVLLVSDFSGWRFWVSWAVGCSFGPLYWLGRKLTGFDSNASFLSGPYALITAVSVLTTLAYLLLVRRDQSAAAKAAELEIG